LEQHIVLLHIGFIMQHRTSMSIPRYPERGRHHDDDRHTRYDIRKIREPSGDSYQTWFV